MNTRSVSKANCPEPFRVHGNVPMVHVTDVDRSAEFYALLGFRCESRFSGHDGITNWAMLVSGPARHMLSRASGPIVASQQAVLFYMYANDVRGLRTHLLDQGIPDAGSADFEHGRKGAPAVPAGASVFDVFPRFYMPEGELRVHDPDGYVILVGQDGLGT
jgi:hypothetical protein